MSVIANGPPVVLAIAVYRMVVSAGGARPGVFGLDRRDRRVAVVGLVGALAVLLAGWPAAVATAIGGLVLSRTWPTVRRQRSERAGAARLGADLPEAADLLAVAAAAGCNVYVAVRTVAGEHDGPAGGVLRDAVARADAGGRLGEALRDALAALPARSADAARPLVAVLAESDAYGTPLAPALSALSADLRAHRHRRAEEQARRIPVRLLFPLVFCVLPAFALLTVAPLLAGTALDALADLPSSRPGLPATPKGLP